MPETFKPGDRVSATFYNARQFGIVIDPAAVTGYGGVKPRDGTVVWARWETGIPAMPYRVRWMLAKELHREDANDPRD